MGKGKAQDTELLVPLEKADQLYEDSHGGLHILGFFVRHDRRGKVSIAIGDITDSDVPSKTASVAKLPKNFQEMDSISQTVAVEKALYDAKNKVRDDKPFMWRFFFLSVVVFFLLSCLLVAYSIVV